MDGEAFAPVTTSYVTLASSPEHTHIPYTGSRYKAPPRPSPLQPLPQLPLLLQNLQLQPLNAVFQRLPPLPHHPRPQPLILGQPPPPSPALLLPAGGRRRLSQPAGLELRARAQRLDAPLLAGEVGVCAVEEEGYEGGYLGAEGGFGGGEGRLGDQFVVLVSLVTCSLLQGAWLLGH